MTRLRPVLMTTAATVFGHMPLVFVSGAGAEARNSIGIMLVTGMTIGTLFTLFILPAVYMLLAADHRPEASPPHNANGQLRYGHAPAPTGGRVGELRPWDDWCVRDANETRSGSADRRCHLRTMTRIEERTAGSWP